MKYAQSILAGLVLSAAAGSASAYHVNLGSGIGYPGTATLRVSGACSVPLTVFHDARLGYVYDDSDVLMGWGLVTVTGDLLALEVTGAEVRYRHNNNTGNGYQTYYIDLAGGALANLIENNAYCNVAALSPLPNSRELYQWGKGVEDVGLRGKFRGYEKSQCISQNGIDACGAGSFSGTLTFTGWVNY